MNHDSEHAAAGVLADATPLPFRRAFPMSPASPQSWSAILPLRLVGIDADIICDVEVRVLSRPGHGAAPRTL